MKPITIIFAALFLIRCKPAPSPQPNTPNNSNMTNQTSLTATEQVVLGKWIFDKRATYQPNYLNGQPTGDSTELYVTTGNNSAIYVELKSTPHSATLGSTIVTGFLCNPDPVYNGMGMSNSVWKGDNDTLYFLAGISMPHYVKYCDAHHLVLEIGPTLTSPLQYQRYYYHK